MAVGTEIGHDAPGRGAQQRTRGPLSAYAIRLRYLPVLSAYAICLRYLPTLSVNAIGHRSLPTLSVYAICLRYLPALSAYVPACYLSTLPAYALPAYALPAYALPACALPTPYLPTPCVPTRVRCAKEGADREEWGAAAQRARAQIASLEQAAGAKGEGKGGDAGERERLQQLEGELM
eukprot:81633-Rhodomonas_salina.1